MPVSPARMFAQLSSATPPDSGPVLMRRAVVLGASVAGLLAARVLSDHCDEVVLIERDPTVSGGSARPGVPQGTQVHSLLPAGQAQLERWFPGFFADSVAAGSVVAAPELAMFFMNGALRSFPAPAGATPSLLNTRPFLEEQIRRRTMALPRVRLLVGRADGLLFAGDKVTGVRYVPSGPDAEAGPEDLPADLVVDATGRSSRLPDWLAADGWPRPPMRRMGIKLNYATALFDRSLPDDQAAVVIAHTTADSGQRPRIGGILPVEGQRWMMLVAGYDGDRPSRSPDDFAQRCREDFPSAFGAIASTCPRVSDVVTYHQADSRRRDFHRLDRFPAGLVVAGDAVASFNPVYGQGMASAALHASCLSEYLRSAPDLSRPAMAYFDLVKVIMDAAWQVSTLADLALPHVDGPYPRGYRVQKWLGNLIYAAATDDRLVSDRLNLVATMQGHPSMLATPAVLLHALGHRVRLGLRPRPAPTESDPAPAVSEADLSRNAASLALAGH
jgi:2-polyprenyl-6-methoxyphenol hydroxylase-like FAD-dependent oxidoreductase